MRLSKQGVENIRRGLKHSWENGTHRRKQQARLVDADTLRDREAYDRKGKFVGSFDIYHSTNRRDQFDVFMGGRLVLTGGPRVIAEWVKSL
jgi:hypothetical protein